MSEAAKKRWATLRTSVAFTGGLSRTREIKNKLDEHCNFEYTKDDSITAERLAHARESIIYHRTGCTLSEDEMKSLVKEQRCVRDMLINGSFDEADAKEGDEELEAEKEEVADPFEEALDQVRELLPPPQDDHSEKHKLGNLKAELMGMKVRYPVQISYDMMTCAEHLNIYTSHIISFILDTVRTPSLILFFSFSLTLTTKYIV